jgi:acetyl-CoA C-acetyltransferase
LTIKGKAYIAGIYEHPTRHAPDKSTAQLHTEVAKGAIEDAGLTKADIDGYFLAGDAPGGAWPMVDYLGLKVRHIDSTDTGGCSYLIHLGHAAAAIAAGKCSIALITLAGKPRTGPTPPRPGGAEVDFESAYGATTHNAYGMCAMRHMHDYATTSEQLAWIKVAASHHAQLCDAQGRRHRRGCRELADDLRSAAQARLLRRHRWRRRTDRDDA